MSLGSQFLAIDLGAESGRAVLGRLDDGRVDLEEVHRFPNIPVRLPGGLHWDVLRIFCEIKTGLKKTAERAADLEGVGVDAWGVDFGLLDRDGNLICNPYHYRDSRTNGVTGKAFARVGREEIYRRTGIQFLPFNTLYQLLAMGDSPLMEIADRMLMIPDLMNYWMTGEVACEYTIATTTQLYDVQSAGWALDLASSMGLRPEILPRIMPPGSQIGSLLAEVAQETGLGADVPVLAVAAHDTASAVVAVPAERESFAYISSGTWSLVGLELQSPVISTESLAHNFTNEGGFGGTIRFLKNVMGLWILQECRRKWARAGREYSYGELSELAAATPTSDVFIDPDHPDFLAPGDMPGRVRRYCEATGQRAIKDPGEVSRCILESLALRYRQVLEEAESVTGRPADTVHIVGGGARNALLCQLTADATRRPVLAGPVEATALGNLMVQALARGYVGSLGEIREVIRRSIEVQAYLPRGEDGRWSGMFERFLEIVGSGQQVKIQEGRARW